MSTIRFALVVGFDLTSVGVLMGIFVAGCAVFSPVDAIPSHLKSGTPQAEHLLTSNCKITEAVWIKPPEDSAVSGTPEHGYYYVNPDRSIWASAWWFGQEEEYLRAGEDGVKVGWFRPARADLEIVGKQIAADGPSLEAYVPCCYPTRFQAAGLIFPTEGCWEITATAAERTLTFSLTVGP